MTIIKIMTRQASILFWLWASANQVACMVRLGRNGCIYSIIIIIIIVIIIIVIIIIIIVIIIIVIIIIIIVNIIYWLSLILMFVHLYY